MKHVDADRKDRISTEGTRQPGLSTAVILCHAITASIGHLRHKLSVYNVQS